jgi:hypothetical protein
MKRKTGGRSLAELSFLHSSDDDVPTWWTAGPVRAATLVGWAGGPKATRLVTRGPARWKARAIAAIGGCSACDAGASNRSSRLLVS